MRKRRSLSLTPVLVVAACFGDDGTGPDTDITGIEVVPESDVLVVGRSMPFSIVAHGADGEDVPAPSPEWSTSDSDVADVGSAGIVTGVSEGEAVITARIEGHEAEQTVRVAPDALPLFTSPPFEGTYDVWNAFDHDLPVWSGDPGEILTWRGVNEPGLEGHDGYDWPMPEDTPLYAVADGVVNFAAGEEPWSCPLLDDELVSAQIVALRHTAPSGERFLTVYIHLNRLDVEAGDTVVAGQQIGLSGNTGCTTGPHLHFEVRREFYQRTPQPNYAELTDPNGWAGSQEDPWLLDTNGAASTYLWSPGAAPSFKLAGDRAPAAARSSAAAPDSGSPAAAADAGVAPAHPRAAPAHMHRFTLPALPPRSGTR